VLLLLLLLLMMMMMMTLLMLVPSWIDLKLTIAEVTYYTGRVDGRCIGSNLAIILRVQTLRR